MYSFCGEGFTEEGLTGKDLTGESFLGSWIYTLFIGDLDFKLLGVLIIYIDWGTHIELWADYNDDYLILV